MSKFQFLLLFLAVGAFLILYNLPRGVIKKEGGSNSANRDAGTKPIVAEQIHRPKGTAKDKSSIENLRKEYLNVSDKEKKVKFADSLAGLYRQLQQYDSSAKFSGIVADYNPTIKSLEKAGDAFSEASALSSDQFKGEFSLKSREFYSKVLEKDPENLEIKSKLALTYMGGDAPMKGVSLLREILQKDPKNETAIYNLGILSIQSGQYKKGIERFKELIRINPGNANAHFYLGLSYLNTGEKQKAKVAFKAAQALENDPAFQATVTDYLKEVEN